ncbi:MAG: creatininase family protein [Planctomycetes bacterium]|nr:creatininase family protein [Planctomycetota bacterium]
MNNVDEYLPVQINSGSWLTRYTLDELHRRISNTKVVLPVCSLGAQVSRLAELAPLVLPPLYHEALDAGLKSALLARINQCFPYYEGTRNRDGVATDFEIVELPAAQDAPSAQAKILAFSVDTAVEEHGPHLPLMTDTIQSYGVLNLLATEVDGMLVGPPVEYGHLTWGLPYGFSIDLTPPLVTRYVTGFVNAMNEWLSPQSMYVVDVHGSIVHRTAIIDGLKESHCERWAFRWLHDPLVEFAGERGDQHAGGVETSLVHFINPQLVDSEWWPDRVKKLAAGQMSLEEAIELSPDLPRFIDVVQVRSLNGIVGDVQNFFQVDAQLMMNRMLNVAREDLHELMKAE